MQQIIANHYYDQTRKLIQSHIAWEILSDNDRDQMISFYELLTVENAEITHQEVNSLLRHAAKGLILNNLRDVEAVGTILHIGMAAAFIGTIFGVVTILISMHNHS
jgi:hypothetical protein